MSAETICPVCDFGHVSTDVNRCPQCDADLKCFQIIDTLPDELHDDVAATIQDAGRKGQGNRRPVFFLGIISATVCLLAVGLFFFLYAFEQIQSRLEAQQSRIREIEAALHKSSDRRGTIPVSLQSVPAPANVPSKASAPVPPATAKAPDISDEDETEFFIYPLKSGDRIWALSKKFYRNGDLYPVLLLHNPDLKIYEIKPGLNLKILKDRKKAEAVFEQVTEKEHGEVYWRYPVREGDTLQSLAVRFYGPNVSAERITDLNPGVKIEAGNSIRIVLE